MKLEFRETMQGTTEDGRRFAFHVTVEAPSLRALAFAEMLRLDGHAELEGAAKEAPLEGTLIIGLPWKPYLEYELGFQGDDGARYRFSGKKTVKLLRFLETMTTLPGTVYKDGAEHAPAVLRFDLRDLPKLAGSIRLRRAAPQLAAVT